jgi:high-affinity Fe2+/Pb2+ permease
MATPERIDQRKPFTTIAIVVLALIALLQLLRFLLRWEVTLNGAVVPVWLSGIAFVIAGGLAVMVWREHRR